MYKIAVVDDDYKIVAELTNIIQQFFSLEEYAQDDYENGLEFVDSLKSNRYDIVFMDLEMDYLDGKAATEELRRIDSDENVFVVFVSSHVDNLVNLFSLHPFDFISKPIDKETVFSIIGNIVRKIENCNKSVELTVGHRKENIRINEIIKIQSVGHKVLITLNSVEEELCCYIKLEDIYKLLAVLSNDFLRIHTSYIVNRKYVLRYSRTMVFLTNNEELPISNKYQKEMCLQLNRESMRNENI